MLVDTFVFIKGSTVRVLASFLYPRQKRDIDFLLNS